MIHFPISMKFVPFETRYPPEWIYDPSSAHPKIELDPVPISETWAAMEDLVTAGLTKYIGICNFVAQGIMDLLSYCKIRPYVLQVELHPYLVQQQLVDYCMSENILVVAFSPLGSSSYIQLGMDAGHGVGALQEEIVLAIAEKINKTPAQVILKWNLQRGVSSVIPKSSKIGRVAENISIDDFQLSEDDMESITCLNKNKRFNDPGEFCKSMGGAIPIYA